jgi:hypothetical protein
MSATQQDVATKAGVSVRTVQRVINDPGLVDDRIRTRVEGAMTALDYTGEVIRRGRKPSEVPLVHQVSLRVDARTRDELYRRGALLADFHGARARGWDAEVIRIALDWAINPPKGVAPMPDDYLGHVNRVQS